MPLQRGRLLLLALGLGLAGAQRTLEEVPLQRGFDARKVEGRWLTLRLASSSADLVSPDDPLRLSLHSIRRRDSGDMDFVLFWMGEGVCEGLNVTLRPTALPGQYRGSWSGGGSAVVRFVRADERSLILYARGGGGEARSLWALLARTRRRDPQGLGRYLELVRRFHLQEAPAFSLDAKYHEPGGLTQQKPFPLSPDGQGSQAKASAGLAPRGPEGEAARSSVLDWAAAGSAGA
ncbi:beta-lactoglobulin [Dasypus novemcinctus]|uniref:beta-lactoglobulin n=1 Tax=Dasypus novemcinctus TaxID=9361 RepID=UPI00265F28A7|nr:beta-lactoglobulin [Dasypus novemcinctus]